MSQVALRLLSLKEHNYKYDKIELYVPYEICIEIQSSYNSKINKFYHDVQANPW
jgi:hypothetical protein